MATLTGTVSIDYTIMQNKSSISMRKVFFSVFTARIMLLRIVARLGAAIGVV